MSIQNRAMLVKLRVSQWGGTKSDASVSNEVASSHGASTGAGSYLKKLIDSYLISDFRSIASQATAYHNRMTLPWQDGGWRILPSELYYEYAEKMKFYRHRAEEVAQEIGSRRDDILEDAKRRLGTMYDEADFPTEQELVAKFGVVTSLMPVPGLSDFRIKMEEDAEQEIRERMEGEIADSTNEALQELWGRVGKALTKLHEQLANSDKRVMQASFDAITDLVEVLPSLNIFDDEGLNKVANECRLRLGRYRADTVRSDEKHRSDATKAVDEILSKMRGYCGPVQQEAA